MTQKTSWLVTMVDADENVQLSAVAGISSGYSSQVVLLLSFSASAEKNTLSVVITKSKSKSILVQ